LTDVLSPDELIAKTQAMEAAEFQLKAPVEFVTDAIRASKIADCNYNGNCGTQVLVSLLPHRKATAPSDFGSSAAWLRAALNDLFAIFQQIVPKAERAAISCAVSAVAMLLAVLSTNAFTSRMRRNVVKVYTSG
jgi:hypothetical protein